MSSAIFDQVEIKDTRVKDSKYCDWEQDVELKCKLSCHNLKFRIGTNCEVKFCLYCGKPVRFNKNWKVFCTSPMTESEWKKLLEGATRD